MINAVLFLCFLISLSSAQDDPRTLIMKKDTELKKIISRLGPSSDSTRQEQLKRITFSVFDFNALAQTIVPKSVWDTCDNEVRKEFIQTFKDLIENTSIQKLDIYKTDSTIYDNTIYIGSKATLTAHLWKNRTENLLVYKMVKVNEEWKVNDLIINELSIARNYREQFTVLFTTKTMQDVINLLKSKSEQHTKQ